MKSSIIAITLASFTGIYSMPIQAGDAVNGKILHEAKCFGCHDTRQYTRKNRIVHTFDDLQARVEFCDASTNAGFSFDELDDVVEYLNNDFYKFKKVDQ